MIENKKLLIGEVAALLIIIGLFVSIFFIDFDLFIFKLVSTNKIVDEYNSLKITDTKLSNTKNRYNASLKGLDTAKAEFEKQKEQYEAITDETVEIIKEATVDEKYNIEYMWIKLGNYATTNNLALTLVEPGGKVQTEQTETDTQVTSGDTEEKTDTPNVQNPVSSSNEMTIKVVGNYINVSQFIFELENDKELRFKLDKIRMEYAGNNQITATFAVKNLVFNK